MTTIAPDLSHIAESLHPLAVPIESLHVDPHNARTHSERNIAAIMSSFTRFGQRLPLVVNRRTGGISEAGSGRLEAARRLGWSHLAAVWVDDDETTARAFAIADNRTSELAEWDDAVLLEQLNELAKLGLLDDTGFTSEELQELLLDTAVPTETGEPADNLTLQERFVVPPFSVLDARQGYWQERKRAWLSLGIRSELGRDDQAWSEKSKGLTFSKSSQTAAVYELRNGMRAVLGREPTWDEIIQEAERRGQYIASGTSIFDPVLCEIAYRWFCPEGGTVLDPFAGGSVRGIVASRLHRQYTGIELRAEQVSANCVQATELCPDCPPAWIVGDSTHVADLAPGAYDLVFSCPPYGNLEVYSDDPQDLSTMDYATFLASYRAIIAACCGQLKEHRFAVFVVGDYRDARGCYHNFVSETIAAFLDAGLSLYNEAILVTPVNSGAIRAGSQFQAGRKLVKSHQNVLVFFKGNPKQIKGIFGDVECGEIEVSEATPTEISDT